MFRRKTNRWGWRASLALVGMLVLSNASHAAVGWVGEGDMSSERAQHGAVLLDDGTTAVFNGVKRGGFIDAAEQFKNGEWKALTAPAHTGNVTQTLLLPSGKVLLLSDSKQTLRVFDPKTGVWETTPAMSAVRGMPVMTLLRDGRVLVAGGWSLKTAEILDPRTLTWTPASSMQEARRAAAAVLLADGRVLVASGFSGSSEVAGAEIYDPVLDSWTAVAPPLMPRHYATLTLLRTGEVLLAGGFDVNGAMNHAELYDPQANTWTATGALAFKRAGHTATALPDGRVLVAGGAEFRTAAVLKSEIYDRTTGTWGEQGDMRNGGENGSATLQPDGSVLFAGGYSSGGGPTTFFATTDRYRPQGMDLVRPVIDPMELLQDVRQQQMRVAGRGLTGTSSVLELMRVENGALTPLATVTATASEIVATLPAMRQSGLFMMWALVDGVRSEAQLIRFVEPPTQPVAVPGRKQIKASWAAPPWDGGNPPVQYEVSTVPPSAGCIAVAPALSCDVLGLSNDTSYTFSVRAVHANGAGPQSDTSAPVVPVGTPDAPTIQSARTEADGVTHFTLTPPADDGGHAITRYDVACRPSVGGNATTGTAVSTQVPVSGLLAWVSYQCTATASNAKGVSNESAAFNLPASLLAPGAPRDVKAQTTSPTQVVVTWLAPDSGSAPTGYVVTSVPESAPRSAGAASLKAAKAAAAPTCTPTPPTATTCTMTGLTPETSYTFVVTASNEAGSASAQSDTVLMPGVPVDPGGNGGEGGPGTIAAVPGLGTWALWLMSLVLSAAAALSLRRMRAH